MDQIVNILMVDDRPENLVALEAVLSSPPYRLIKASSGEEALKWVLKLEFAVILLDVQMPGIDGFETARLIRAREKSKDVPILFITALSQTLDHVMHGYSVGAIDYIFKPFHPAVLKSKVAGFVDIYLNQKQLREQKELLKSRTEELEIAYSHLRRSEALARAIADSSLDTIVTLSETGKVHTINPAALQMFGYSEADLADLYISNLLPVLTLQSLFEFKEGVTVESEGLRKDRSLFPVEVQICGATVQNESVLVCSIRDITERKNQYQMLKRLVEERTQELTLSNQTLQKMVNLVQESERRYRELVEESPESIFVRLVDAEHFTFVNETGLKLLGAKSKEDVIPRSIFDIIHADYHHQVYYLNGEIKKGKKPGVLEEQWVRLDGEIIDVEIKAIPFLYLDEPSLHIVVRDITELKRSREIIQHSDKLTVVGELAAGIAHEIRNPLTSLRGFVQLLGLGHDFGKEYSHIMLSEIDRINSIVSELLLLAKPRNLDFAHRNLREMLDDVITLLNAQANLHGVQIVTSYIEQSNSIIFCEENKIKQVFINILKNAIEAMTDGGQVTIEVVPTHQEVCISFVDEGCGIPEELLPKIGQPFYTTKEKGTGLGMMISHSIIQSHQGTLNIHSQLGKGTVVEITLPATTEA
ncbi:PAS domain S-box protein [Ammoniphilus sp. YIM 78166]|uniref:PAS domain S-box protein n=1 Tax=Ammoniphilus sp. YIM 78166 TaxID=1644106 RepID=UPI00106FECF0|nr:PAS domain S-box protein [Ammoniphilus sp. YIM 78166]